MHSLDSELSPTARWPAGLWSDGADTITRLVGRLAGKWKRMHASAASRGIIASTLEQQQRFEAIVGTFRHGYDAALDAATPRGLAVALAAVGLPLRGFAYEGAGMALALRETLNPWHPPLLAAFIAEYGDAYTYLLHVGVGWTFGLVPRATRLFDGLDPLLRWLAFDGMGFRDFFFTGIQARTPLAPPAWVQDWPDAARAYDQGVGRGLWFAAGGNVAAARDQVERFAPARHGDLWAGLGLAAVYAGVPGELELRRLRSNAGKHHAALAQGAAFAAKALQRGGQLSESHQLACLALCGVSAAEAAAITDEALVGLSFDQPECAYAQWRLRIADAFPQPAAFSL